MFIFTTFIVFCLLGLALPDDEKTSSEVSETKAKNAKKEFSILAKPVERPKDLRDCEYEYVRDNLRKAYFDNGECYDIARRIRTDAWFRHSVEKSVDRGTSFCRAVEDALDEHGKN